MSPEQALFSQCPCSSRDWASLPHLTRQIVIPSTRHVYESPLRKPRSEPSFSCSFSNSELPTITCPSLHKPFQRWILYYLALPRLDKPPYYSEWFAHFPRVNDVKFQELRWCFGSQWAILKNMVCHFIRSLSCSLCTFPFHKNIICFQKNHKQIAAWKLTFIMLTLNWFINMKDLKN